MNKSVAFILGISAFALTVFVVSKNMNSQQANLLPGMGMTAGDFGTTGGDEEGGGSDELGPSGTTVVEEPCEVSDDGSDTSGDPFNEPANTGLMLGADLLQETKAQSKVRRTKDRCTLQKLCGKLDKDGKDTSGGLYLVGGAVLSCAECKDGKVKTVALSQCLTDLTCKPPVNFWLKETCYACSATSTTTTNGQSDPPATQEACTGGCSVKDQVNVTYDDKNNPTCKKCVYKNGSLVQQDMTLRACIAYLTK